MMKRKRRLYSPVDKDEICYQIEDTQAEIRRIKNKAESESISEWEYTTLLLLEQKLKHLKEYTKEN